MEKKYTALPILVISILLISSISPIASSLVTKNIVSTETDNQFDGCIEVRKYILADNEELTEYEVEENSIVRFRVKITYHDVDEEDEGVLIKDIIIKDILPEGLEYYYNASRPADEISNNKIIIWNLTGDILLSEEIQNYTDTYILEFDVKAITDGTLKNKVQVNATELCYGLPRYNETSATLKVTKKKEYTLNTEINGSGQITINPNKTMYHQNEEVTLIAIPDNNWTFDFWSGNISGDNSTIKIKMDKNKTVIANFKENNSGELPKIEITKPKKHISYYYNIPIGVKLLKTKIIGPITIKAEAESKNGIEKVEFYIDGKLKQTDEKYPYKWTWWIKPITIMDRYNITVVAYDKEGNKNSDEITVHRERANFILAKLALIGKLIFKGSWNPNNDDFLDNIDKDKLKKFILIAGLIIGTVSIINRLKNNKQTEPVDTDPDEPDDSDDKNINQNPVAKITAPKEALTDQIINFDGSNSYDPDEDEISYEWDFGDGNKSYKEKPSHAYEKEGKYTVELTVKDVHGVEDSDSTTIEIKDKDSTSKEDNNFWYIVSGLGTALLASLGTLYFRRRYFV